MAYYLPPFKDFKPIKLRRILKKIVKDNNNLKYDLTNEQLRILIKKIINQNILTALEYEILLFNFDKIIVLLHESKIETFLNSLKQQLIEVEILNNNVVIKLIYDNIIRNYSVKSLYENIFKEMGRNIILRNNISLNISKYFLQEYDIFIFLRKKFIDYMNQNDDYLNFNNLYRLSVEGKIYKEIVYYFFLNYINTFLDKNIDLKLIELFKKNIINISERKDIYNKIFEFYRLKKVDDYNYNWFKFIDDDLEDPNKKIENWYGVYEEYINMMKIWIIKGKLEDFFGGKDGYDKKRLKFWKQYIKYLISINFIKELHRTIIMKTDNHIFIEFGEVGNAFFIYENNADNLNELEEIENGNYEYISDAVYTLKNLSYNREKLSHSGSWFYRFQEKLSHLGYKMY